LDTTFEKTVRRSEKKPEKSVTELLEDVLTHDETADSVVRKKNRKSKAELLEDVLTHDETVNSIWKESLAQEKKKNMRDFEAERHPQTTYSKTLRKTCKTVSTRRN